MNLDARQCIFGSFCSRYYCDMSCVKNTISQILLEKSDIKLTNNVYKISQWPKMKSWKFLNDYMGKISVIESKDTVSSADTFVYSAICNMCEGHGTAVTVYHLKYSQYIQKLKNSWNTGVDSYLREIQAHISSAKYLVISSLDYVYYNDFESQTLLNILQDRTNPELSTVLIVSNVSNLSGKGAFLSVLKSKMKEATTAYD